MPLGVYNPGLVRKHDIEEAEGVNEERYDEEGGMFMSPIKRTQEAVQRLELGAAQRKLWKTNSQRPSVEERMFLFERLQIILNNEARNRAHEAK